MKDLETMQREGQEKVYKDIIYWVMNPSAREAIFTPKEANDVIDQHTTNVWMAAQESIKKSILESGLLEEVRKETWEEAIKLSEEIERVEPDGGTRQWIAFKRFRNTLRDYLSALDNTPPNKV